MGPERLHNDPALSCGGVGRLGPHNRRRNDNARPQPQIARLRQLHARSCRTDDLSGAIPLTHRLVWDLRPGRTRSAAGGTTACRRAGSPDPGTADRGAEGVLAGREPTWRSSHSCSCRSTSALAWSGIWGMTNQRFPALMRNQVGGTAAWPRRGLAATPSYETKWYSRP